MLHPEDVIEDYRHTHRREQKTIAIITGLLAAGGAGMLTVFVSGAFSPAGSFLAMLHAIGFGLATFSAFFILAINELLNRQP